jgi:hypothetical protein
MVMIDDKSLHLKSRKLVKIMEVVLGQDARLRCGRARVEWDTAVAVELCY